MLPEGKARERHQNRGSINLLLPKATVNKYIVICFSQNNHKQQQNFSEKHLLQESITTIEDGLN